MITREELIKSSEYWIETIQNRLYNDLVEYIEKNNVSNKVIAERMGLSKGRVSQLLSGKYLNFRLDTLVRLCLAIERIPDLKLTGIDEFILKDSRSAEALAFTGTESQSLPSAETLKFIPGEKTEYISIRKDFSFDMGMPLCSGSISTEETKAA